VLGEVRGEEAVDMLSSHEHGPRRLTYDGSRELARDAISRLEP